MATESGLGYTLRPPKSYTAGRRSGQPTVIVMHTTEGSEGPTSAEDGASYDARRTDGTSTHFFVDQNSVVQCVRTTDEAHAARTHGNDLGIQIEICGKAGQGSSGWADTASAATLENVARLCVKLRAKYPGRFPLRRLTTSQLRATWNNPTATSGGFAGHVDCTNAFPEDNGTHTDPGPSFPWNALLNRIEALEGDDMEPLDLLSYDPNDPAKGVPNPFSDKATNKTISVRTAFYNAVLIPMRTETKVDALTKAVASLAAGQVDVAELASAVGAALIPAVVTALQAAGAVSLTVEQVEAAAEAAITDVLRRGVDG